MTKHLRFLFVMLLAVMWSAGWAAVGDTYQKVTSETELFAGDIIVFANDSKNMAMGAYNTKGYYDVVNVTIKNGTFSYVSGLSEFEIQGETGNWTFKNGNSYLLGGTKSNLKNSTTISDKNKASLDFQDSNDCVKIEFGTSTNLYLCLNDGAKRFACYAGSPTTSPRYTQIYKKVKNDKQDSKIAFSVDSYTANISDKDNTYHTYVSLNNPNNLNVSYKSSNTDVAEVNSEGDIKIIDIGTTTITASFAGDATYNKSDVSYTLIVNDPNAKIVTFNAGVEKGTNTTSGNDELSKDNITITATKTAFGRDDEYRLYANSEITFSVTTGTITKIKLSSESNANGMDLLSGTGYSHSDDKLTGIWKGNAQSVLLKNIGTKQSKVKSISVYVALPTGETITLNEEIDNTITAATGVNVTLKRNLVKGAWNTICLPFELDKDQTKAAFGDNAKVAMLDEDNSTANTLSFTDWGEINANIPFLIKPSADSPTEGYKFEGVNVTTIKDTENILVTKGQIAFIGVLNPTDIKSEVETNLGSDYTPAFLGAGNTILKANDNSKLKGFRAYFAIPSNINTAALSVSLDGVITSINEINGSLVDDANAPVYNLQGQRVNADSLTRGIYVKNGKKFAVK